MTTPWDILTAMLAADPARPRLTWYGAEDERVELSAKVLHNWVCKAANLLLEEADLDGGTVALHLPVGHWRSYYWALATWACGAALRLDSSAHDADVVVTAAPVETTAGLQVVVNPAVLARCAAVEVPPGALDEAAELATYGDTFAQPAAPADDAPALFDGPRSLTFRQLGQETAAAESGGRLHVDATTGTAAALRAALATWRSGGSVVVTTGADPAALERVLRAEGVTGPATEGAAGG